MQYRIQKIYHRLSGTPLEAVAEIQNTEDLQKYRIQKGEVIACISTIARNLGFYYIYKIINLSVKII